MRIETERLAGLVSGLYNLYKLSGPAPPGPGVVEESTKNQEKGNTAEPRVGKKSGKLKKAEKARAF